jgi:nickel/cobalt transporter (NicO) family protein
MSASSEAFLLSLTAASIGAVHTLLGPDHSIPFVAMSRAGKWSARKTLWVTAGCGLGHVAGSLLIGLLGLALGVVVMKLEAFESLRGDTAAWMLIGFGLAYLTWGIVQAVRKRPHAHVDAHADGTVHNHRHAHDAAHVHVHDAADDVASGAASASVWTPWLLFLVFVFGPCEPLIPLLMYPAAKTSPWAVAAVVASFTLATVATMTLTVMVMRFGISFLHLPQLSRFSHAFAGLAILICGILVSFGL